MKMENTLSGMLPEEIRALMSLDAAESFRSRQIFRWISKGVFDFSDMTNIPLKQREQMACEYTVCSSFPRKTLQDPDGTMKIQMDLHDGTAVETVLLVDSEGRKTACVSCQAGCPMGCAFCKTGSLGFNRNLMPGEIVEQFLCLEKKAGKLDNIVFMGMGEPLLNLEAIRKTIAILTSPEGRGLSRRRITVSTAGICSGIYDLADNGPDIRLAVSLTTGDSALREKLMPVEKTNPLPELKKALAYFCKKTGGRVTLEAVLLKGVNMTEEHADKLRDFCRGLNSNINLIPWNPAEGLPFSRPSPAETKTFADSLRKSGLNVTVRHPRGRSISGACGQLGRTKNAEESGKTGGRD